MLAFDRHEHQLLQRLSLLDRALIVPYPLPIAFRPFLPSSNSPETSLVRLSIKANMRVTAIFSIFALPASILAAPLFTTAAADFALVNAVNKALAVRGIDLDYIGAALESRGIDVTTLDTHLKTRGIDVRAIAANPAAHAHLLKRDFSFSDLAGCTISQLLKTGLNVTELFNVCGKEVLGSVSS